MKAIILTLGMLAAPLAASAAGTADTPPKPTETTETCTEGLIWDLATQTCMTPDQSTNDDSARLNDVRELAYDGQYLAALDVLNSMTDQADTDVLTYYGFAHRKAGNVPLGMAYYQQALAIDPANIRARSYMGQAYVETGEITLAQAQLTEIRRLGGRGTWSEWSLSNALRTGHTATY